MVDGDSSTAATQHGQESKHAHVVFWRSNATWGLSGLGNLGVWGLADLGIWGCKWYQKGKDFSASSTNSRSEYAISIAMPTFFLYAWWASSSHEAVADSPGVKTQESTKQANQCAPCHARWDWMRRISRSDISVCECFWVGITSTVPPRLRNCFQLPLLHC